MNDEGLREEEELDFARERALDLVAELEVGELRRGCPGTISKIIEAARGEGAAAERDRARQLERALRGDPRTALEAILRGLSVEEAKGMAYDRVQARIRELERRPDQAEDS